MANKENNIRPGKDIIFADGKVRTIYPATIRELRALIPAVKGMEGSTETNDETIDQMMVVAQVILRGVDLELAEDPEKLEDAIDMSIFNDMVAAAMGTDPNA